MDAGQQRRRSLEYIHGIGEGKGAGSAASGLGKVRIFDLHRHGFSADLSLHAVIPYFVDKRSQLSNCEFEIVDVFYECVFGANGFANPIWLNLAVIDATGNDVKKGA